MPQPKQTNGNTAEQSLTEVILDQVKDKGPDEYTSPERQFMRALDLERQRSTLMKSIASNREYLRLMEVNGELSDQFADWLEDFYPQKEKGERRSQEEVERTRLAKAAARGR